MKDTDRLEKLTSAIEEMVEGRMPEDSQDEELQELLQIASIRRDAARTAAQIGARIQSDMLERLKARLASPERQENGEPGGLPVVSVPVEVIASGDEKTADSDIRELQDVIGLRRGMAEHAATIAERHREAVWQRVQTRIQAESEKRGILRWPWRRRDKEAENLGAALDRMILGEPIWEADDSRLGELLGVARARRAAATAAHASLEDQRARVWARLRPRLLGRLMAPGRPRVSQRRRAAIPWGKLAAGGAVAALVLAAAGPIPATGLAHHPATALARFVGDHIGVSETSAPPVVPPVTEVIQSNEVTSAEAGDLLDLAVYEPTVVPDGYHQVSSQYFPKGITAEEGGLFVLAYEDSGVTGSPERILIYQEHTSSNSIAVERGFAQDIALFSGIRATYVNGTWRPLGSDLSWSEEDGQSIIFDLNGLRTTIHTTDGDLPMGDFVAIADSLVEQVAPPTS